MKLARGIALALGLLAAPPLAAQQAVPPPPKLVVVISVDQFSADLFAEYRNRFRGGFERLLDGAVFPSGYQSHAATETCPGHSTILTGDRPSRTGIVANDWQDFSLSRGEKGDHQVYCAEDESVPGTVYDPGKFTVSDKHLLVPTLGEWMKAANPASRVVVVSGKDRSAVMMGGHKTDEIWWWGETQKAFVSYAGRAEPAAVARTNAETAARLSRPQRPLDLPAACRPKSRAFVFSPEKSVGAGRFARDGGDARAFRASPEFDAAIVGLAARLAADMKLGSGAAPDLLIIGASATDYVGHAYGTEGSEMCLQLLALDRTLGTLFRSLDKLGVDYEVMLTADHGGHDIPERNREHGAPAADRVDPRLNGRTIGAEIAEQFGMKGRELLLGGASGDMYVDSTLPPVLHDAVLAAAVKAFRGSPQVAGVFTGAEIAAAPAPQGPPETWTLIQRARASYYPGRSGDFVVALEPRITPIADPAKGSVATHGSFWDYDRRVPILFWRKGMTGFEQPLSVETVDIAPTLAAQLRIPVPVEIDGRCLDLDAGERDSCK